MNHKMIEEKDANRYFDLLRANAIRSHQTITAVFLSVDDVTKIPKLFLKEAEKDVYSFIESKIRQSDFLFKMDGGFKWAIILTHSGEAEAEAFMNRLYNDAQNDVNPLFNQYDIALVSSIAEVRNVDFGFSDLINAGEVGMERALEQGSWSMDIIEDFNNKDIEKVKISILEKNDILRNTLRTSLENIFPDESVVEIRTFGDGLDFLESDWYYSSHKHLVIMDDILPRKNGMEVLNFIRNLPNDGKFTVFMMTKRNAEDDMMQAYDKGVDEYLIKPFNLRLFEARIRRNFARIWA